MKTPNTRRFILVKKFSVHPHLLTRKHASLVPFDRHPVELHTSLGDQTSSFPARTEAGTGDDLRYPLASRPLRHGPTRARGWGEAARCSVIAVPTVTTTMLQRSEEHTSELQSRGHLVCRLLLE